MPKPNDVVYIVMGSSGEYSDHVEWVVGYCKSKNVGREYVKLLMENAHIFQTKCPDDYMMYDGKEKHPEFFILDPNMDIDSSGINYDCFEAKLLEVPR